MLEVDRHHRKMPHGRPAKRRRLDSPIDDSKPSETVKASDLLARAADWDLEQEYELRSRRKSTKEPTRLPTYTSEGKLQPGNLSQVHEQQQESDSFLGSNTEDEVDNDDETPLRETETPPQIPVKQKILEAKEETARLATLLNEDPEEHASAFRKLAQLSTPDSPIAVQKLVIAAQAAVYKDVIPGYRIRTYKDEDLGSKISKDVRQSRQYEKALVTGYQDYVKHLSSLAKNKKDKQNPEQLSLRSVAIKCVCTLLLSVPHFNFRTELLNVLVHELAGRELTTDFSKCIDTLEKFFSDDEDGAPSLEAVTLLTKMMRVKDYRVREEVLNSFFHLRLLSELTPPGSTNNDANSADRTSKVHGRKVKRERSRHLSKKDRKLLKERKAVEKDMSEASALVNHEEREKMQSETLKLVFATYFRILKARIPGLMGAVLEGLARYAHLINQDLFGDLLEALKEIVGRADMVGKDEVGLDDDEDETKMANTTGDSTRNLTRETLLATQTAFTLLSGQDASKAASSLNLDLSFFTAHTYRSLYLLSLDADIELGPKSLRLPDPHTPRPSPGDRSRVNISTPILLLTRVLTSILLTPSSPPPTLACLTFFKRLLATSLHLPEKSALAILSLLQKIADKHGRKIEALWYSDERKGDGIFRGESESMEGTNVLSTGSGVWEVEVLKRHYCPKVREAVGRVEGVVRGLHR